MKNSKLLILLILLTNFIFASNINKQIPNVVPVSWLKQNIDNKKVVILDIRPYEEYKKGHIKGAVNIPGLENLFDKDTWMMPKLNFLKELFSNAGIKKDSLVVAYDNGDFFWAARLYWILEVLGHHNVGILKYSYGNYVKNNLPISTQDTKVTKSEFIPRVNEQQIATKLSTLLAIGKKTIIDGRSTEHYEGKKSIAKRFGHIPTAKNYACTNNYQVTNDGNKMKDFDQLKKLYKNIPKDQEIILYCDGGAEAALNYIVLTKLGYKASIYDGSWKEWGNDSSVPVENPSKKNK
jgi:thiosulfate/3-mercaptopyruvate sulfurtransferase